MKKVVIAVVLGLVFLTGCSVNGVRGRGDVVTNGFEVEAFSRLRVSGAYRVVWREADGFSVDVSMHENLFEYLDVVVVGDELRIQSRRGLAVSGRNTPTIYVYSPSIEGVNVSGAVSLADWDLVSGEGFSIDVAGAASADLRLEVTDVRIDMAGAGDVVLLGDIQTATVNIAGAGNVDIDVSETLSVDIAGAGSVRYGGNPYVTRRVAGVGTVRAR